MFRVENKDIKTTSTLNVSLVDFEEVNVCWEVRESLLNDFWSILKMLCIKCCPWFLLVQCFDVNSFLNKNAGDKFTYTY